MTDETGIDWIDPSSSQSPNADFPLGEQDLLIVHTNQYVNDNKSTMITLDVKSVTHPDAPTGRCFFRVLSADKVQQADNIITIATIGHHIGIAPPALDDKQKRKITPEWLNGMRDKRFHATVALKNDFIELSKIEAIDTSSKPTPEPEADLLDDDVPF